MKAIDQYCSTYHLAIQSVTKVRAVLSCCAVHLAIQGGYNF